MLDIELIRQIDDISLELRRILGLPVTADQFDEFEPILYNDLVEKIQAVFSNVRVVCDAQSTTSYMLKIDDIVEIHVGTDMPYEDRIDSLMHEMAHFVLHAENIKPNVPVGKYTGTVTQETEANCFSRAFLVPQTFFIKALTLCSRNDGSVAIRKLADYFKVQESLIIERGRDLMIWN